MSYHQSACKMKKTITPASNAQSAIRSNVESRKAPNWVPPVVSFAIEPSRESASTSNVSTTAPAKSHPRDAGDEGNHNGSNGAYDRHRIRGQANGYQRFGKRFYELFEWCAKMF